MKTSDFNKIHDKYLELLKGNNANKMHDTKHLESVMRSVEDIYNLLPPQKQQQLDINILKISALLHDITYAYNKGGVITYLTEGYKARKYLKRFLKNFNISQQEKDIIIDTVYRHPHSFPWHRLNKKRSLYAQVVQDADTIDLRREEVRTGVMGRFAAFICFELLKYVFDFSLYKFLNLEESKTVLASREIKNIEPRFLEYGNKDPNNAVILLHGYRDTKEIFENLARKIGNDKYIISIDFPFVFSNRSYTILELAVYIKNVLDIVGIKRYSTLGFSLGGTVAVKLSEIDNRMDKIILINSSPRLVASPITHRLIKMTAPLIKLKPISKLITLYRKHVLNINEYNLPHHLIAQVINILRYDGIKAYENLDIEKHIFISEQDEIVNTRKVLNMLKHYNIDADIIQQAKHEWEYIEQTEFMDIIPAVIKA